jgi:hypothetical protein
VLLGWVGEYDMSTDDGRIEELTEELTGKLMEELMEELMKEPMG